MTYALFLTFVSYLLSALSITTTWLMGNKSIRGPIVGLFSQVIWIYYCLAIHQFGLLVGAAFFVCVHTRNIILWRKEAKK
jgi:hypothetical protein